MQKISGYGPHHFNDNIQLTKNIKTITKHCILIIEDNIYAAESLGMVIETFGHTVYIAHNSLDGIQKAEEIKPNVILCDIGLPEINGYQIAKILKSNKNLCPYMIALSGYARASDIEKSHHAGFDTHIAKPPNLTKLEQILLNVKVSNNN